MHVYPSRISPCPVKKRLMDSNVTGESCEETNGLNVTGESHEETDGLNVTGSIVKRLMVSM